jgi:WS/DGAT/MGAT family acyltransferase
MAEPLSPADRSSLAAEQGAVNMAVGGLLIFQAGASLTHQGVARRIAERIHLVPRLRQRLREPAMGVVNPVWVDDVDFDIDWHVRHTLLPAPGDRRELCAFVGRESSRRLDRTRPLWEITVIDGLSGGSVALLVRLHHALVDGMGALALGALLIDPTAEPLVVPPPERDWEPRPYTLRRHLTRLATAPVSQAQRFMIDGLQRALDPDPRRAAAELRRTTELMVELARNRPQAPMTPLNVSISANRRWASVDADLDTVKRAARAVQATVNDVILAAVTGMLRNSLEQAGPGAWNGRPPVALVPVSVRRTDEQGELGNRISTVLVDLPADLGDPLERLRAISARMSELKGSAAVRAGALMQGAAGAAPPLVSSLLARALSGVRAFNLVVTNIPGPRQPLYLDGAQLLAAYPVVPLNPANQALNVGILSYHGGLYFGLTADANLDPPVDVAAAALQTALGELCSD